MGLKQLSEGNFRFEGSAAPEKAVSLLQVWLFFGLIPQMLNVGIDTSLFVKTDKCGSFITTEQLPKMIEDWQNNINEMLERRRQDVLRRMDNSLDASHSYFLACIEDDQALKIHHAELPLPPEVRLSIAVLHSTLCAVKNFTFPQDEFVDKFLTSEIITTRILRSGWCPSDIEFLAKGSGGSASTLELYYTSLLGERRNGKDHALCTSSRCEAFQTDETNYQVKHLSSCGGCPFVEPDMGRLCSILEDGLCTGERRIPLLRLVDSGEASDVRFEIIEARTNPEYVAVSHVFGDGLGNPRAAALPACQLKILQRRANRVMETESAYFWMDTLCVPPQPDLKTYKISALLAMKDIYLMASTVLVER